MRSAELRVAHVVNRLGPGGVARVAFELMTRLPADQQPMLYCLAGGADRGAAALIQTQRLQTAGIPVRYPSRDDKATATGELTRWLAEDRIDLVHTHSSKPNRYARPVALAAGVRTVAHFHNHYDDKWRALGRPGGDQPGTDQPGTDQPGTDQPGADLLDQERELCSRTTGIVACSTSVRDHVAARVGVPVERIRVIRNGVQTDRFTGGDGSKIRAELGIPDRAPLIGTVGRLCAQKAQDDFLRSVPTIAAAHPAAVFLVVGRADETRVEHHLRTLAAELGVTDRVHFTGFRDDLADVYAALDVCVMPSRWEGFGLVLAEAMAAGVPLVATAVGPVPDVVAGAGLLVPADRPDRIAAAVDGLLGSPETGRRLIELGRRRAAQFGWQQPANDLARYYESLLGRAS